jgi:hypothetical protein
MAIKKSNPENLITKFVNEGEFKKFISCGVLTIAGAMNLNAEVLFTPRAKENPQGVERVIKAFEHLVLTEPENVACAWVKKPDELGYIGDINIDFNIARLEGLGILGSWYDDNKTMNIRINHTEVDNIDKLSLLLAHEGFHAWIDTKINSKFFSSMLPIEALYCFVLEEVYAYFNELNLILKSESYKQPALIYEAAVEFLGATPEYSGNPFDYYLMAYPYNKKCNPTLSDEEIKAMSLRQFTLALMKDNSITDFYMNSFMERNVYSFREGASGTIYTPDVLNPENSYISLNSGVIAKWYTEQIGLQYKDLGLTYEELYAEFLKGLEANDVERKASGKPTIYAFYEQMKYVAENPPEEVQFANTMKPEEALVLKKFVESLTGRKDTTVTRETSVEEMSDMVMELLQYSKQK